MALRGRFWRRVRRRSRAIFRKRFGVRRPRNRFLRRAMRRRGAKPEIKWITIAGAISAYTSATFNCEQIQPLNIA